MFSFFSPRKVKTFFFASLILLLLTGFFTGCGSSSDDTVTGDNALPNRLLGRWVDPGAGDIYELTRYSGTERVIRVTPDFGEPGDANFWPGLTYGGIVRHVIMITNTAGIIIFEHTGYIPNPSLRFGAVGFLGLTANSVQMSTAWEQIAGSWDRALAATLEDAKEKFTADTIGNYIGIWGGPYFRE